MKGLSIVQRTMRDARRADGLGSIVFDRLPPAAPETLTDTAGIEPGLPEGRNGSEGTGGKGDIDAVEGGAEEPPDVKPIYGADFEGFMRRMWRWQYTRVSTPLDTRLMNTFYEETQGIVDLMVKLFVLCQMRVINAVGRVREQVELLTPELVREVAADSFNAVRPFIRALRDDDREALENFEDLVDLNAWLARLVAGIGTDESRREKDDGEIGFQMPPMMVPGAIGPTLADELMNGLSVPARDRAAALTRHAALVESGNVSEFIAAMIGERAGRSPQVKTKLVRAPHAADDLRAALEGAGNADDVAGRVGVPSLESALD